MLVPDLYTRPFEAADLEAAVFTLSKKLQDLQETLSPEERALFSGIVRAAAAETAGLRETRDGLSFAMGKSLTAAATAGVRRQLLSLSVSLDCER
jgi:hypothetical protein